MIRFHNYTWLYILVSSIIIGSGIVSLIRFGYRYSIDFTGGTTVIYKLVSHVSPSDVETILKKMKIKAVHIDQSASTITIQTSSLTDQQESALRTQMKKVSKGSVVQLKYETVGPVLGKETGNKTVIASILAICGILVYMSFAFKGFNFALAAVLAMIHDFLVVLGTYSIISYFFGAEFDLMFVTALLTTMSFSVHDTIVIFDKIREYVRSGKGMAIEDLSDQAVTETMVRSLNNSLTIVFMLLALLLLGGATIRFFVATLLIGTITGTYSSPFVATPLLIWLEKQKKK